MADQRRYVVIGNGVAGIEAAKRARALDQDSEIIIISRESLLHWSRPALMYIYMGELSLSEATPYPLDWFKRHKISLLQRELVSVERSLRKLNFSDGSTLTYDALLLALGSRPRTLDIEPNDRVMGLYHLQDLERLERLSVGLKRALIIGGGLVSVEWAEMLVNRNVEVHIAIREPLFSAHMLFPEEAEMITEALISHGVHLHQERKLVTVTESDEGNLLVAHLSEDEELEVGLVGVAIGVQPAVDGVLGIEELCRHGVLVDQRLQTKDERIFAAGDCAEMIDSDEKDAPTRISGTWYESRQMGRVAGESLVSTVLGSTVKEVDRPNGFYNPRVEEWYNSAKFFETEYQEYGQTLGRDFGLEELVEVGSLIDSNDAYHRGKSFIFWRHASEAKSLRILFDGGEVIGFVALGIRLRQLECERFIRSKYNATETLSRLVMLRFDEEFDDTLKRVQSELLNTHGLR